MKVDEFAEDCHGANEDEKWSKRTPAKILQRRTTRLQDSHRSRKIAIWDMTGEEAKKLLNVIYEILWPLGDYEIEWTQDTIDEIALTIQDATE